MEERVEQLCVVLMRLGQGNRRLMARKSTGSTRLAAAALVQAVSREGLQHHASSGIS